MINRYIMVLLWLLISFALYGRGFTVEDDFCGSSVLVMLNQRVGAVNRTHDISFFQGIDIIEIVDLSYYW